MNDEELQAKRKRNNLVLAWVLGGFVIAVMLYSMRFIWPHVDIFSK